MSYATDAARISIAGQVLFFDNWVGQLAKELNVNERTMRRIRAAAAEGKEYPAAVALIQPLKSLMKDRVEKLNYAIQALEA